MILRSNDVVVLVTSLVILRTTVQINQLRSIARSNVLRTIILMRLIVRSHIIKRVTLSLLLIDYRIKLKIVRTLAYLLRLIMILISYTLYIPLIQLVIRNRRLL